MNDAPSELEQVRAAIKAKAEARADREEKARAARELAQAKRELADAEAVDKAECEHGAMATRDASGALVGGMIASYPTERGLVIVKRPNHLLFRKFQAGKVDTTACETLVRTCLVHPSKEEFDALAEELPAILVPLAGLVTELAGLRAAELQGK